MKTTFILISLLTASAVHSAQLMWEPATSPGTASYVVHWGTNSGQYTITANVGNVTNVPLSILPLVPGVTYYLAVTTITTNGIESVPSNEIIVVIPVAPKNFRLSLEAATDPAGPWNEVATLSYQQPMEATRFYRGVIYPP